MPEETVAHVRECVECQQTKPLTREYFPGSGNSKPQQFRRICKLCYNAECKVRDRQQDTPQPCKHCGELFTGRKKDFCKSDCRILHIVGGIGARYERLVVIGFDTRKGRKYLLLQCDCGNTTLAAPGNLRFGNVKSCGCYREEFYQNRQGPNAANWKGGRMMKQGYVYLHNPSHPNAMADGYVAEHIYVMAEFLGRRIRTDEGEEVHHRNGQKTDNVLDNLELWKKSQPAGQRIEDLVAYARGILKTYAQDVARLKAAQSVTMQPDLFTE